MSPPSARKPPLRHLLSDLHVYPPLLPLHFASTSIRTSTSNSLSKKGKERGTGGRRGGHVFAGQAEGEEGEGLREAIRPTEQTEAPATAATESPLTATIRELDPYSPTELADLANLYCAYLLEEYDRTGEAAPGFPVAVFLRTILVKIDGHTIGFCSIDTTRYAVELVYLDPAYRHGGLGRSLLAWLASGCPQPMRAKAPLSPAGYALVHSLGIQPSQPGRDEEEAAEQSRVDLHRTLVAHCRHKRIGNPARPCPRCFRKHLTTTAETVIAAYSVIAAEAAGDLPPIYDPRKGGTPVNVEDVIAERIEAARRRIAADRERRARFKRARDAGLVQRYRIKTALLDAVSNATPAASGA